MSLYQQIGAETVVQVITEFYRRAFDDRIIGHFFMGKDRAELTRLQISFATALLGGPRDYRGKALESVHGVLQIRRPHLGRRRILMAEVLAETGVAADLAAAWLKAEDALTPLILKVGTTTGMHPGDKPT